MKKPLPAILALAAISAPASVLLAGCVPTVIASGVAVTGMVAQDRTLGAGLDDAAAEAELRTKLMTADARGYQHVTIAVNEGVLLLTGVVPTPEMRIEVERFAWTIDQVDEVGNELEVGAPGTSLRGASDTWLVTQIRTRFMADSQVKGINFSVEAHDGVVYLLGRARSERELERAAEIASLVRGVEKVVTYMSVRGPRGPQEVAGPAPAQPAVAPQEAPIQALPEGAVPMPSPAVPATQIRPLPALSPAALQAAE
jgi:osmotically-inducible protein OsmY